MDGAIAVAWTLQWIVTHVRPTLDIHALWTKVSKVVNKATLSSHANEVKKIFMIPVGRDIFAYHAALLTQIRLVGLNAVIPSFMEQSLIVLAACQNPQYQNIILDLTAEGKTVSVDILMRELQKHSLLISLESVRWNNGHT